ncbi:MAG: hypothetical protein ABI612_13235 [Betaproteobacteria bacterium]
MPKLIESDARWASGRLLAHRPLASVFDSLMARNIVVLHHVFSPEQLAALREQVHAWGQEVEKKPPQVYIDENFHAIESGISPRQKTPHCYHAYNFNELAQLQSPLSQTLLAVFQPLRAFQNELTGNAATFERDPSGAKLHPQVIQYPSGGGLFGRHSHPLEPQRVGLILGISERGRDFEVGATHFEIEGEDVGTDNVHDIGDLILFRFDIPHWITPVDPHVELDYNSSKGRWTLVLPYY